MTDKQRAGVIGFLQSLFPVLVVLGIAELNADQISILMLCINNGLTLLALFWKPKERSHVTTPHQI